jgi:hypothetical protein
LCVADVGSHEANLRLASGQASVTNTEFVAASGREVSMVEAPITNTGEAVNFLNQGFSGLQKSGRISSPIRASIPTDPVLQPGNYLAVVEGSRGGHALHATVTDEIIGRRFISEGKLITEAKALEIMEEGGRVVTQPVPRVEYFDPQKGMCVVPPSRPRSFVKLE